MAGATRAAGPLTGRLAGKVAVVTGAGTPVEGVGVGAAISVLLAREGAGVVLGDLDGDRAARTAETIGRDGGRALVMTGDVTDEESCAALVRAASTEFGALHVLVNNVGRACPGSVVTTSNDAWDLTLEVNLRSVLLMSRYAVPAIAAAGGGSIVNIASIAAVRSMHSAAYAASKGGMIALTRDMAVQHAADGVRVNVIAPGHLDTPLARVSVAASGQDVDRMSATRARATPLGSEGSVWDVAWAAVYLASDEARWVTGITLPVDGGVLCAAPLSLMTGRYAGSEPDD
jgi:NAD(P)-dependent dehydrogenase (short-subunit alcohol dehydrogenase family)